MLTKKQGFSLLEIVVALGVFAIIAGAGMSGFGPILKQNRQSAEIVRANRLAEEGLEAARSIRNRNFTLLSNGTKGIGISEGVWSFIGTNGVVDKYTRRVSVKKASRDAGGSLVASGGTTDPDTFFVKSWVTWNYSVGQTKSFSLDTVLTNWKKGILGIEDAVLVYGRGTSTVPRIKSYNVTANGFSTEAQIPNGANPRTMVVKTSPTKKEAVVGIMNNTGTLYVYCFNGSGWSLDWSVGTGVTATVRPFNVEYETNSGDALVIYGTGATTTNEMAYRVKLGTDNCGAASWSSATTFNPARTAGKIQWIKVARDVRSSSNLIAAVWADFNKDLSGAIFNGTSFVNEVGTSFESSLEAINTGTTFPDVDSFDLSYESISGDLMVVWGNSAGTNGTNGTRYRTCTGGTSLCTWGANGTMPSFLDDATNLDISSNPNTDEMVYASIGNAGADLQIGYWSGVGWTDTPNADITCTTPVAGSRFVATGWLNASTTKRSIITYYDSGGTGISFYQGNLGVFTSLADVSVSPAMGTKRWMLAVTDPLNSDRLMYLTSDTANRLFAKRLVMNSTPTFTWTNSDGAVNLGTTLSQNITSPFGFAYFQQ